MNLERIRNRRAETILQFAVPSVVAMILTSMINIVDGYFIGNYVGKEGLAAVNLGLPIVYLYLAAGLMIAVGGSSIAGRLLGAKQIKEANAVFRQTVAICILLTAAMTVCIRPGLEWIARMFGAGAVTGEYFVTYYGILIFELPVMVLISSLGMFVRGEGNPVFVMLTNLLTVILNVVLDYLFVGPLALGVAGVAAASLTSAGFVLIVYILYFLLGKGIFRFGKFSLQRAALAETFFNGSSEFIGELSMCISMAAYNYAVLQTAGVDGLAAFTIVGYVSYVFSMIIVGFGQGIVPLVSFAYGAEQEKLAVDVRNTTLKMVAGAAVLVFAVMFICSGWYSSLFSDSREVRQLAVPGLRLQMSSFLFAGINTIATFYFTAIGKAKESAVISASRGLVVLLIAIYVLPKLFGITGVWLVSLVTETVTLLLWSRKFLRSSGSRNHAAEIV